MQQFQTYPQDLIHQIEFDKIVDKCASYCYGTEGKLLLIEHSVSLDLRQLKKFQDEIYELVEREFHADALPIHAYESITEDLYLLSKEDYVLEIDAIQRIHNSLIISQNLFHYFNGERLEFLKVIKKVSKVFDLQDVVPDIIHKVINEEGEVRPNASPTLKELIKKIEQQKVLIGKEFNRMIQKYKNKGFLADNIESYRLGRRVLVVPAEKKRQIKGVILDESSTGKTAFIEPESIFEMNNEIFHLEAEKRSEIYRILKELCKKLHPHTDIIKRAHEGIVYLDAVNAKAKLAVIIKANKPVASDKPKLWLKGAKNPVLILKFLETGQDVVQFDLCLEKRNSILLVSGPNAGGKSVLMKTVALIQYMYQKGFPIPVQEDSIMGIYHQIYGDIGDQQSIEDDLSTYSSKLKNLKFFIDHAGRESLLVIDEFGSGTDPKLGGAIAESVLRELNYKKVSAVITTHYSNLKIFAYKNPGIVNGAMIFNTTLLKPSYELKIGRPGSSFAFEIAQNAGLSAKILKYAKFKAGKSNKAVDELLIDLQTEKKEIEDKIEEMRKKEKELDRMSKSYAHLQMEMDYKRKKLKFEEKQKKLVDVDAQNRQFEKLIRELKESQNIEKAKTIAKTVREEKKSLQKGLQEDRIELVQTANQEKIEFKVGDPVKLRTGSESGTILSIKKGKADVVIGHMQIRVAVTELLPAREAIETKATKSINTHVLNHLKEEESTKLDIRGMIKTEALMMVEQFLDNALLTNRSLVKIIHGKGTGALKALVKQKLKEYNVEEYYHPADEAGGDGATFIRF